MATIYTDKTQDVEETLKVIEKEYTIPETTATIEIDMGKQLKIMNDAQSDIEKIVARFNTAMDLYNEGLNGISSKTKQLTDAVASFPEVPAN